MDDTAGAGIERHDEAYEFDERLEAFGMTEPDYDAAVRAAGALL